MKEFPSEIMEYIAEGDTIIFNFPLSIFNSAAEWLPDKLKFECKQQKTAPSGAVFIMLSYSAALILAIMSSYSASVRRVLPGFMAKGAPHSYWSLYLGTRWKCRWQPPSP